MLNKINKKRIMKELLALITAFSLTMPIAGCSRKDDKSSHEDISEVTGDDYYNDELSEEEEMERLRMSMVINDYITDDYSDSDTVKDSVVVNNRILDMITFDDGSKYCSVVGKIGEAYSATVDNLPVVVIDSNKIAPFYASVVLNGNDKIENVVFAGTQSELESIYTEDALIALENMTDDDFKQIDIAFLDSALAKVGDIYTKIVMTSDNLNKIINGESTLVYMPEVGFLEWTKNGLKPIYSVDNSKSQVSKKLKK